MNILVLNAGSSSLKYSLINLANQSELLQGLIERIGENLASHRYQLADATPKCNQCPIGDHQQALQLVFATLKDHGPSDGELAAIGHRVVHGGEQFRQSVLIDAAVISQIKAMIPLAPLHNPANLQGIEQAMRLMADIPQVAVFDTAFHQSLPEHAYRYALPATLYQQHGVRRYGFHGTSHAFVAKQAAKLLKKPWQQINLISMHLGNGASITAIKNGMSVDTSMGMTPLEGLMMGSRCGDIDPAIHFYLSRTLAMPLDSIEALLNKDSGCKGICGENDMRSIHSMADAGDDDAKLALAMYAYRIKKYIGAYAVALGRVDALIFTGGIGENDAWLRQQVCQDMQILGIDIDRAKNQQPVQPYANISSSTAKIATLVIKTNEELEIAQQTAQCLNLDNI